MQLVDDILQVISSRVYKAGFYMVDHSNLRSNEGGLTASRKRVTMMCKLLSNAGGSMNAWRWH